MTRQQHRRRWQPMAGRLSGLALMAAAGAGHAQVSLLDDDWAPILAESAVPVGQAAMSEALGGAQISNRAARAPASEQLLQSVNHKLRKKIMPIVTRPAPITSQQRVALVDRAVNNGSIIDRRDLALLPSNTWVKGLGLPPELEAKSMKLLGSIVRYVDCVGNDRPGCAAPATIAAKDAITTYDENWMELRGTEAGRTKLAKLHFRISEAPELKALYAGRTVFPAARYAGITTLAGRLVQIHDLQLGIYICGGTLVSPGLVLTAGHCLKRDAGQTDWSRFGLKPGGQSAPLPVTGVWPEAPPGTQKADSIDFAFARFDVPPNAAQAMQGCVVGRPPTRWREPVAVLSFDQGNTMVYDYAFVWIPHMVSEVDYKRVVSEIETRIHRSLLAQGIEGADNDNRFKKQSEQLKASLKHDPSNAQYLFMAMRKSFAQAVPNFMFDTDTRHGHSGSPVISRSDNKLLGVFTGGAADTLQFDEATWTNHEFGTPYSAIKAYVDAQLKAGRPVPDDVQAFINATCP